MTSNLGEKQSWVRRLVHEHQTPLIHYARSIVRDEHLARDVVQETFLQLCRQTPEAIAGREAAWLFRVCHNLAINRQRKDRRMTTTFIPTNEVATHIDPDCHLSAAEDQEQLSRLIEDLPENQQKVIRLKFHSGLKYREISESTGLSVGNVGFLLHTALQTLRQQLQSFNKPFHS